MKRHGQPRTTVLFKISPMMTYLCSLVSKVAEGTTPAGTSICLHFLNSPRLQVEVLQIGKSGMKQPTNILHRAQEIEFLSC